MGAICESCLKDIPHNGSINEFEIEHVKKRNKTRNALPSLIKIQSVWRGYITRKRLHTKLLETPLVKQAESKLGKFEYSETLNGMEKRPPFRYPNKSIYIGEWNSKTGLREGKGIHI